MPRAVWKGFLQVGELQCPVSLFTAVSASERIAFHTINRETGHRVRRQFFDSETDEPVLADQQVKGYDTGSGDVIILEPEEIAAAVPENDKTLAVQTFLACDTIDTVFFDRPYYVAPSDPIGEPVFTLLRDGLQARKVAALATAILFRRVRTVLIRAHEGELIATLLKFDYEVRSSAAAFDEIAPVKMETEMVDLALHIIKSKAGTFDPKSFEDRYEAAVADLVRAKIDGRPLKPRAEPRVSAATDLLAALRESAKATKKTAAAKSTTKRTTVEKTTASETAIKKPAARRSAGDREADSAAPRRKAG